MTKAPICPEAVRTQQRGLHSQDFSRGRPVQDRSSQPVADAQQTLLRPPCARHWGVGGTQLDNVHLLGAQTDRLHREGQSLPPSTCHPPGRAGCADHLTASPQGQDKDAPTSAVRVETLRLRGQSALPVAVLRRQSHICRAPRKLHTTQGTSSQGLQ